MTGKRFRISQGYTDRFCHDWQNNQLLNFRETVELLNELYEENYKIRSILLKKVEELNNAYNKSARAGMPTGGIIGELDSFEEICEIMGWVE